jgi:hypothetical protein
MTDEHAGETPVTIDRAAATQIARAALAALPDPHGLGYTIRDELTQEHSFGWVFFHDSRRFIETGEAAHRLAGNAPLIVDRRDGRATFVPTGRPLEDALRQYATDSEGRAT